MRIALSTLAFVVTALLALAALATFNLRVFVEAHRHELIARGQRVVGRDVTIGGITPSWWPIGIRFADVAVGEDPRFGIGAFLDAATVRVALRPVPLVLGRIEVARIVFDRPHVSLVRDASGRWNVSSLAGGTEARTNGGGDTDVKQRRGLRLPLVWFGLTASEMRDGRIDVEDRTGPTPRRFTAVAVRLRASELRLGADARVRLDAAIFPGSVRPDLHLDVALSRLGMQDGAQTPFAGHLELADADLETLATMTGQPPLWAGRAARITADATGALEQFAVTLAAHGDGEWRVGPHLLLPRMAMRIDADAEVTRDTIRLGNVHGDLGPVGWTATGMATLRPWHYEVSLRGTDEGASWVVAGRPLSLTDLRLTLTGEGTLRVAPAHARLDDMSVDGEATVSGLDPLLVTGRAHVAGPLGTLDAGIEADSRATVRGRVEAADLDVGAIARRVSTKEPHITGRGTLSAAGSVPFVTADPVRGLSASGTARLESGSIAVVNVAAEVLRRVPGARLLPQLVGDGTRARAHEIFETAETSLGTATLPFTVADGVLSTPHLAVTANAYDIGGEGSIDHAGALRFHGSLVFSPDLSASLRGDFPMFRYVTRGDGRLELPFRMHGPLAAPVVEPELKRIHARKSGALAGAPPARDLGPAAPPGDPRVEERDVERLEHMLRP